MELTFVRHAEAARDSTGPDRADPGLSENGRRQVHRVARYLAEERFEAVYCSPLRRARETAQVIGEAVGRTPAELDGLAEFDRHAPEYLHFEDLRAANDPRYFACMSGDLSAWGTDVETFRAEIMAALDSIVERHPTGRVVVVTHGGVLNGYLGTLVGANRFFFHRPDNTGVSRVEVEHGRARLVTLNERPHLRPSKDHRLMV